VHRDVWLTKQDKSSNYRVLLFFGDEICLSPAERILPV
jgi:hypothetical protein